MSGRDNLESHQSIVAVEVLTTLSFARLPGNVPLAAGGISPLEVGLCVQKHSVPEFETEMSYPNSATSSAHLEALWILMC